MQIPTPQTELIGEDPVFLDALAHASALAPLERPLLVIGERGTGKELFASRLHFLSTRWDGPLVKVNCAAMNDALLESELFGHEAGAFTGASKRHAGRFERAKGGTLFLDEIATASSRVQEKLLRVIEYGEYERIGGETTLQADVRIVAATNEHLPQLAAKGKFRADLLDRLSFDVIHAPPLRARPADITALAAHFGAAMASELGAQFEGFSPTATKHLRAHDWPGNVRELKNTVERSVFRWLNAEHVGAIDEIVLDPFAASSLADPRAQGAPGNTPTDIISAPPPPTTAPQDLRAALDRYEREITEQTLDAHHWHQKKAAQALSLTYDQLRGIIKKHGLNRAPAAQPSQ